MGGQIGIWQGLAPAAVVSTTSTASAAGGTAGWGRKSKRCHAVTTFVLLPVPWYSYPVLCCPTGFHAINVPSSSVCFFGKNPTSFQPYPKVLMSVEALLSLRDFGSGHQCGTWYVGLPVTC